MLENAQRAKAAGREVVVGYVEPHARTDTQALLHDFEQLPTKVLEYRRVKLREFDVDAAIQRRPDLILVDELAHTNAEGSRHIKRWQDVDDLLEAGIHVWTMLNAAQWVIDHSQLAGAGTNTLPNSCAVFFSLVGANACVSALAIRSKYDNAKLLEPELRQLLEACASQLALALESDQLAIDAAESRIQAEAEQVRSTLLSGVSHDLNRLDS